MQVKNFQEKKRWKVAETSTDDLTRILQVGDFLGDYFSCKEVEENIKSVAMI